MIGKINVAPPAGAPTQTNAPELTVSELSNALKRTVEDRFGHVRVRGEISNYRGPHSSGHAYFSLKDANARLDAVVWKSAFARLKTKPEEGLEVIATGRITTFPGKSAYQIVIEAMEVAGVGALMALLDERRKKLAAEGLFAQERKRALPFLPAVIGIVTSPTGAVIRDILHRVRDRFPRHVLVWPVRVQGETSAEEVAAAIAGFNELGSGGALPRPDVLIVARGGGSLEDLWSFNEEIVVRAAAASTIPVISAVGHETDTTLIDHAADRRAPTPTGAAEICVPVRLDLVAQVADLQRRRHGAMRRGLDHAVSDLRGLARALPTRDRLLELPRQHTDRAGERCAAAIRRILAAHRQRLAEAAHTLARHTPHAELRSKREALAAWAGRLERAADGRIVAPRREQALQAGARLIRVRDVRISERAVSLRAEASAIQARLQRAFAAAITSKRGALEQQDKLLESFGYTNVLARGFALVRNGMSGAPLKRAADVTTGAALEIQFADGSISAQAGGRRATRRSAARAPGPDQGTLF